MFHDENKDNIWLLLFCSFVWEPVGSRTDLGIHEAWKLEALVFSHRRLTSNQLNHTDNHTGWHEGSGTVELLPAKTTTILMESDDRTLCTCMFLWKPMVPQTLCSRSKAPQQSNPQQEGCIHTPYMSQDGRNPVWSPTAVIRTRYHETNENLPL